MAESGEAVRQAGLDRLLPRASNSSSCFSSKDGCTQEIEADVWLLQETVKRQQMDDASAPWDITTYIYNPVIQQSIAKQPPGAKKPLIIDASQGPSTFIKQDEHHRPDGFSHQRDSTAKIAVPSDGPHFCYVVNFCQILALCTNNML